MLAILRIFCVVIFSVGICICGIIYCLFAPCQPQHAAIFGRLFGRMAPIFGIQLEIRNALGQRLPKNCVYISNHQNNYDMVTVSYAMQSRTVTVGKKSLLWIPLFGQLYWLTGNILINRSKSVRAYDTVRQIIEIIKRYDVSVWIFPEGTRNYGKGLLPFKSGAFRIAMSAKVPIVPICVSNISNNKIKLNRWSNGLVIVEIMSPVDTCLYKNKQEVHWVTKYCHGIMLKKLNELNKEVVIREMQMNV